MRGLIALALFKHLDQVHELEHQVHHWREGVFRMLHKLEHHQAVSAMQVASR